MLCDLVTAMLFIVACNDARTPQYNKKNNNNNNTNTGIVVLNIFNFKIEEIKKDMSQ